MLLDKSISIVGCYFEISKCSIVILFKEEKTVFVKGMTLQNFLYMNFLIMWCSSSQSVSSISLALKICCTSRL